MSAEPFLTTVDVAEILQLKPCTIRKMCTERRIPFVKLGGSVRFRPDDIRAWTDENLREAIR
jgi:excisionase family DNA binding protein